MSKNIIAPPVRFQGFTAPWRQRKFADLATVRRGLTYKPHNVIEGGKRVLRSSNINENTFQVHNDDVFVDENVVNIPCVNNGDILITSANGSSRLIGKHAIIRGIPENSAVHGGFMLLASSDESEFVNALMSSLWYTKFINAYVAGGNGAIGNLNKNDLEEQIAYVPQKEEMHKIGDFFGNLDHLITLHQHKLELQKKLKAFFLKNMFPEEGETVPRIRFKEFAGDWEQRKLGEIGTTFSGLSGKAKEDFGHGEAQFVTYMNVYLNAVSDSSMTERVEIDDHQNKVQYGDVFFTTSSETPDEVGMSSVWFGSKDNTYLNSFCFGFRPTKEIDPYYMAFMLRSDIIRRKIIILAQGISRYNLSKKQVMKIAVPLPELSEQYKIGAYLQSLDHLITLHQRKLDQLQVMKKFMLQNLFV